MMIAYGSLFVLILFNVKKSLGILLLTYVIFVPEHA